MSILTSGLNLYDLSAGTTGNSQSLNNVGGALHLGGSSVIGYPGTMISSGGSAFGAMALAMVYIKNVPVLITGTQADIAMITVPSGITRWCMPTINVGNVLAESTTGALGMSSAVFRLFDQPSGGGIAISAQFSGPTSSVGSSSQVFFAGANPGSNQTWSTSSTVYVRQQISSTTTGLCSFYITIQPLP